ncbi:MAG: hypothetical protein Phyf2KO_18890 [Phycisphaerales bacterium]
MKHDEDYLRMLSQAREEIDNVISAKLNSLGRKEELGSSLNFEIVVPIFVDIQNLFKSLDLEVLDRMSKNHLGHFASQAKSFIKIGNEILDYKVVGEDAPGRRRALLDRAYTLQNTVFDKLANALAMNRHLSDRSLRDLEEAQSQRDEMLLEIAKLKNAIEVQLTKAEQAVSAINEISANSGVSENARYFASAAEEEEDAARKWRLATIWMIVLLLVASVAIMVVAYRYELNKDEVAKAIQIIASKLLIMSALSYTTIWCAKNYRARQHNVVVNRHRQRALSTFQTFVHGTENEAVKDTILVAAAGAAFAARASGYEDAREDVGAGSAKTDTVLRVAPTFSN